MRWGLPPPPHTYAHMLRHTGRAEPWEGVGDDGVSGIIGIWQLETNGTVQFGWGDTQNSKGGTGAIFYPVTIKKVDTKIPCQVFRQTDFREMQSGNHNYRSVDKKNWKFFEV